MSEDGRLLVEILVEGDWTQVHEEFDELRRRWRLAHAHDDLLELTGWEGPLLLRPDALTAACNPVDRAEEDEAETDLVWPEVDDADMAQAIEEVSGQHPRRSCEGPPRTWSTSAAGDGVRRTERGGTARVGAPLRYRMWDPSPPSVSRRG